MQSVPIAVQCHFPGNYHQPAQILNPLWCQEETIRTSSSTNLSICMELNAQKCDVLGTSHCEVHDLPINMYGAFEVQTNSKNLYGHIEFLKVACP